MEKTEKRFSEPELGSIKKLSNRERFRIKQNLLEPLGSEGQYQRVCYLCT